MFSKRSDPSRRRVLKILQEGSKTAGELAESFDITKGSLSLQRPQMADPSAASAGASRSFTRSIRRSSRTRRRPRRSLRLEGNGGGTWLQQGETISLVLIAAGVLLSAVLYSRLPERLEPWNARPDRRLRLETLRSFLGPAMMVSSSCLPGAARDLPRRNSASKVSARCGESCGGDPGVLLSSTLSRCWPPRSP
jgi:hypothetical protein